MALTDDETRTQQHCEADPGFLAARFAGPDGVEAFNRDAREQTHRIFPSALTQLEIDLIGALESLQRLLESDESEGAFADVFVGTHLVRLSDMLRRTGRRAVDVAIEQLSDGGTLRWRNAEQCDPGMQALVAAVERTFGGECTANAYLTPPNQLGFPSHFDNTDVFVVQVYGSKSWHIHERYTNLRELPSRDIEWSPELYRPCGPAQELVLSQGDVLYIPRGVMHSTAAGPTASMHWTFSLDPWTCLDALKSVLVHWAEHDVRLRRRFVRSGRDDASEHEQLIELSQDLVQELRKAPGHLFAPPLVKRTSATPSPSSIAAVMKSLEADGAF